MNSDPCDIVGQKRTSDPFQAPAGWRLLVPGLPHWYWDQRDQAIVFFGFHAATMAIALFAWGTWLSLLMLSFAFVSHAFSAADAIKQAAFPQFSPWAPIVAAFLGLGAVCYAPVLILGSMFAWPVVADYPSRAAYWVNRWAYRGELGPRHGETIWLRAIGGTRPRLARVLAGGGQKVRWSGDQLAVDDLPPRPRSSVMTGFAHDLEMTVPDRHVLVSFHADPAEPTGDSLGWEIIPHEEVHGRAWARSYPVWDRCLLR